MLRHKRQINRSLLDSSDEDDGSGSEDLLEPKKSKTNVDEAPKATIPGLNPSFQKTLNELGLILDPTNDCDVPHALNCEQGLFKDRFEKKLQAGSSQLRFVEEQLCKYLDDDLMLLKALMPVQGAPDARQDPDSLIRIFLNIET